MTSSSRSFNTSPAGRRPLDALDELLQGHPQRRLIERAVVSLIELSRSESETDAWRLVSGALADIKEALQVFRPHRAARKITVFGSARAGIDSPSYGVARELAALAVEQGFQVMTGAGGGIMEAANAGAGCDNSIGLNVDLPYEQHANAYVSGCGARLLHFRYFFTRKLFFLRESDALVVLPGGFGTLDELFEALTLIQTGRTSPIPLVLLAPEGDDFWQGWQRDVHQGLAARGLISPEDSDLVQEARSAAEAIQLISRFYRVFHATQLGDDRVELLLHAAVPPDDLARLNREFDDLVDEGEIRAGESVDDNGILRPCLRFHFDMRRVGRLYQLIDALNALELEPCRALEHPGQRLQSSP